MCRHEQVTCDTFLVSQLEKLARDSSRSLPNVILGGFGDTGKGAAMTYSGTHTEWSVDDTVKAMVDARSIIIVPGYGE